VENQEHAGETDISPVSMEIALLAWRKWQDSDEPDIRVFIRELFSIRLFDDATSEKQ
jgi:hypothetical protein